MAKIGRTESETSLKKTENLDTESTICGYLLQDWNQFTKEQRLSVISLFIEADPARNLITREFANLIVSEQDEELTVCGVSCIVWNKLSPQERVRKAGVYFLLYSLDEVKAELIK